MEIDAPDEAHAAAEQHDADLRFLTARRIGFWLLVVAVVLSPLVITLCAGRAEWFAWRMFSVVNAPVIYEIEVDGAWGSTDLDDLGRWDRGRHIGTANLDALCDARPQATASRRLIDGHVDVEVDCR